MKTFLIAAVLAGASVLTATPLQAPTQGSDPTFKSSSDEIVLDLVVRDKKGRQMTDLNQGDFTIIDNGETRAIKSFRRVEGTEAVSSTGGRAQLDPLRQLRLITLVFQGGDLNAKRLSKDAAMELIKSELAQNVYISVMAIDHKLQRPSSRSPMTGTC